MYKLIRADKEWRLIKTGKEDFSPFTRENPPLEALPVSAWRRCSPREKTVWREFIRSGRINPGGVPAPILDSWQRCLRGEVEYAGGRCRDILSPRELAGRESLMMEVAGPLLETLHHFLKGQGFVVVLIDHDGYILKSVGDRPSLRRAEKINFGPGANWSELSVGTNAIGTALALGRPIQVTGPEHYNDGHHVWTCAATPIRDSRGRIAGCLDISGPRENAHFQIQDLTLAAARFIEEQLHLELAHQDLIRTDRLLPGQSLTAAGSEEPARARLNDGSWFVERPETPPAAVSGPINSNHRLRRPAETPPIREPRTSGLKARRSGGVGGQVRYTFGDIIGLSPAIRETVAKAERAAASSSTVLILGESGTGKEVLAQAIHGASRRASGPFVSINCGAIPKELIQSELFGYSEGAFTGALRGGRRGKIELAQGGTLFLDEIADMPLDMQANLLRVIEDKTFLPVGGDRFVQVDIRITAATNRRLDLAVTAGLFREDLYYRLNVLVIRIPPLRERGHDVRLLAEHYLKSLAVRMGKPVRRIAPAFLEALAAYRWPGNVRELVNVLEQALTFMPGDELLAQHLPPYLRPEAGPRPWERQDEILPLSLLEKHAIEHALRHCRGNMTRVARALGIGRNTLYSKIKKYGLKGAEKGSPDPSGPGQV
ncbi:MAG: sigma-54-dependent Fis family transcriptional regulator [Thermodesulfobacteriota bacterium]